MSDAQDESPALSVRFKKRKALHPKRVYGEEETSEASSSLSAPALTPQDALEATNNEEETGVNLREILRNRKRPRERTKEAARKAEDLKAEVTAFDASRSDQHTSRFVGQTGQVIDRDDEQM